MCFSGSKPVFGAGPRNGMHKFSNATLVTDDDRIVVDDVDLYDFTPTLLDLLEIDVDADFDGRSLVRA